MERDRQLVRSLNAADLAAMVLSFTLAAVLVSPGLDIQTIQEFMRIRISVGNFILFALFVAIWQLLFFAFGLYRGLSFSGTYDKAIEVLKATSVGTGVIAVVAVLFRISFADVRFLLIFWSSVSLLAICNRVLVRQIFVNWNRRDGNNHKILIVGANSRSVELARQIQAEQRSGERIVGFVDDTTVHAANFERFGFQVVAEYKDLAAYLGRTELDEVLVCLPVKSRFDDIAAIVAICEEQGIAVGILRDLFKWNLATSEIKEFGDRLVVAVRPHAIYGSRAATKRSIDVLLSALLLAGLLPLFVIVALVIKLTSPGPALFSQERVGLNKQRFRMLKFRTMVVEAEHQQAALEQFNEAAGPAFKINRDPRVTGVGKILRKFSIDEFPQLINVVKGEMSLVGPRPLPIRDYEGFREDWHRRRVSVRPGMTGLWQTNGRDHDSFDAWMKLDLQYIDGWTLLLDFKVIIKTLPTMLRGSGK